jgi:ChrR Cupin-like domain
MMSEHSGDPTIICCGQDRDWIPVPAVAGADVKVLAVSEERRQVVANFRFAGGATLPPRTHHCFAIAYTISGVWSYDGRQVPPDSFAWELFESSHRPVTDEGAELLVSLTSETGRFIENHMPGGTSWDMDMAFFKALDGIRREQAARLELEVG